MKNLHVKPKFYGYICAMSTTVVPLFMLLAATLPNVARISCSYNFTHLSLSLAKGHLSNVATVSWKTGWPY